MIDYTDDDRLPVTILTGFLGAGKTTLLNNLIKSDPEYKFAVIENEFGEIPIDNDLIVGVESDNIYEMSNGCICCTLNGELAELLFDLLNIRHKLTHLIVETTGIADPSTVVQAFMSSEQIETFYRIDSVVCIVDARNLKAITADTNLAAKQISYADTILINKTDLVSEDELSEIEALVRSFNPFATVYKTSFGSIEGIKLLDTYTYAPPVIEKFSVSAGKLSLSNGLTKPSGFAMVQKQQNPHHDIESHSYTFSRNFDPHKFNFWLDHLVEYYGAGIYRIKGIVSFDKVPQKVVVQSVRDHIMISGGDLWENEERLSRIIFIGKNLGKLRLEDSLIELLGGELQRSVSFLQRAY
ncbi:MAG: GTP-binding protein [Bacteroidetes bacterium HGW-Bacteroidetes-11]|jgi:G3E family GTPase|nr:MAG: GTP-binding protein [Bacteroidetes bacterium HGW-Bacteroidetes-11]